ncbi:MAG TPA: AAA family ATPase [Candidatus Limnocylindrales bacterium]|nr:AAA family ATPase [Candidatus Limnocylindrales bacterium]
MSLFLRTIRRPANDLPEGFPYSVPVIRVLESLDFSAPVTFFVGENGSGKSTLLEAIACAAHLPAIGSERVDRDPTLAHARALAEALRWSWGKPPKRGFFLRAEDFFGYARSVQHMRDDLGSDLKQMQQEFAGRGKTAQVLAAMPYARELNDIQQRYGTGLDAQSHGESFIKLFRARFVPDGLYLLDEPEAPLSPTRQFALMLLIKTMLAQHVQCIIATHSPILLAYPGAAIWSFDGGAIHPVAYDEVESVQLTRDFLNHPATFLRQLMDE